MAGHRSPNSDWTSYVQFRATGILIALREESDKGVNAVQTTKVLFTARTDYRKDQIAQKGKRKTLEL